MDKMHDINNIKLTPNTPSLQTSWVNNVLEPSNLTTRIKTYVSPSISQPELKSPLKPKSGDSLTYYYVITTLLGVSVQMCYFFLGSSDHPMINQVGCATVTACIAVFSCLPDSEIKEILRFSLAIQLLNTIYKVEVIETLSIIILQIKIIEVLTYCLVGDLKSV